MNYISNLAMKYCQIGNLELANWSKKVDFTVGTLINGAFIRGHQFTAYMVLSKLLECRAYIKYTALEFNSILEPLKVSSSLYILKG